MRGLPGRWDSWEPLDGARDIRQIGVDKTLFVSRPRSSGGLPCRWEPLDGMHDARAKLSRAGFVPRACAVRPRKAESVAPSAEAGSRQPAAGSRKDQLTARTSSVDSVHEV